MMNIFTDLFDIYDYVVKEKEDGTLSASPVSIFLGIAYFIMALIILIVAYFEFIKDSSNMYEFIPFLFFIAIGAGCGIYALKVGLKLKKAKDLKRNGIGIVKKLKVSEICKAKVSGNRELNFNVICVKAKDGATPYYSLAHLKGKISGISESDLKEIYSNHGFAYDEDQSQKKELLNLLEGEISKMDQDIQNSWVIKSLKLNKDLDKLIEEKGIIESGDIPQFWEVDGNKISVGDSVDVYIDPNNPEIYWMDIDFLFDE